MKLKKIPGLFALPGLLSNISLLKNVVEDLFCEDWFLGRLSGYIFLPDILLHSKSHWNGCALICIVSCSTQQG